MSVEGETEVTATSGADEATETAGQVESGAITDDSEKPEGSVERPRKDGAQKRIDRLTREKYQLRAELDMIRRQLNGGESRQNGVDRAQFESDQDYVEAVVEARLAQKEALLEADRQAKRIDKIFSEAEKLGEFDRDEFAGIPVTPMMAEAIIDSDVAAKIVLFLHENPDEAERISELPKARQAAAIGKIEDKIESAVEQKPKQKTSAPEPIKPVTSGRASAKFRADMSLSEYAALRGRKYS